MFFWLNSIVYLFNTVFVYYSFFYVIYVWSHTLCLAVSSSSSPYLYTILYKIDRHVKNLIFVSVVLQEMPFCVQVSFIFIFIFYCFLGGLISFIKNQTFNLGLNLINLKLCDFSCILWINKNSICPKCQIWSCCIHMTICYFTLFSVWLKIVLFLVWIWCWWQIR